MHLDHSSEERWCIRGMVRNPRRLARGRASAGLIVPASGQIRHPVDGKGGRTLSPGGGETVCYPHPMAALQPNDARFLLDFLLPQLQSEHAVTRRIFSAVPLDFGAYRPSPKSMSAFELVRHIAICELWFLDAIITGQFDEGVAPPGTATTCQDVEGWYSENFSRRVERVEQLSGAELAREIDYIGLRHDPAVAYLNIAIRHTVHHRGQLSTYLRAIGARVPAIYVESADEPYPAEDGSTVVPPAF